MRFHDRHDAGRRLADRLGHLRDERPVVLGLPRGGVPVAYRVAEALDAPLDVALVRKIGAPGAPEYAVGAVVDGEEPRILVNAEAERMLDLPRQYVEAEAARQIAEIERQRRLYIGDRAQPKIEGETVIVVDDGIATGSTVRLVLHALRERRPKRLVLAVPVAPAEAAQALAADADEVVIVDAPEDFRAVGLYYDDFGQTTDEEVVDLLAKARH